MSMISSVPFLFAAQVLFLLKADQFAQKQGTSSHYSRKAVLITITALTLWGCLSAALSLGGLYDDLSFLSMLPGLWLPLVPIVIAGLVLLFLPLARTRFHQIALAVPPQWWIGIQTLRLFAVGTLIKTVIGQFPVHVELAIGLTDLAFGLSAAVLFSVVKARRMAADAIALWHIVGILIILIPGELAVQTGLPGGLQVFSNPPTAEVMLDFPMVLAPTLVVPVFLMLNALGAYAALQSQVLRRQH